MSNKYTGGCLCGKVRFEIAEILPSVAHCHCSMCRKFTGAAYATYAGVMRSDFRWTSGEKFLRDYVAKNDTTRKFCGRCGSGLVFSSPRAPDDIVEIALATVDQEVNVLPNAHIYVDNKASWTVLNDELPKYSQGRDSETVLE